MKTLYLLPHVAENRILKGDHVNQNGEICHGYQHLGDHGAFTWQLSKDLKHFVLKSFCDGHSVPQILTKHIDIVEEAIKNGKEVNRDMFLHEREVWNLAIKVTRETYMLDKNDASSVKLWVQENRDNVFYYIETSVLAQGELNGSNMPFTLGIQTK